MKWFRASLATLVIATTPIAFADARSEAYVATNGNRVLQVLSDASLTDGQRAEKFSKFMNEFADFKAIARRVLGSSTRSMTEEQLEEYYAVFEEYAVAVYQDQLDQFRGESITVVGSKDLSDRNSHVTSKIRSKQSGKDVEVIWDVLSSKDGQRFLVRDVALNIGGNNSFWLAVDQYEDFQAFLKQNGNNTDKLIENIRAMTRKLNARD